MLNPGPIAGIRQWLIDNAADPWNPTAEQRVALQKRFRIQSLPRLHEFLAQVREQDVLVKSTGRVGNWRRYLDDARRYLRDPLHATAPGDEPVLQALRAGVTENAMKGVLLYLPHRDAVGIKPDKVAYETELKRDRFRLPPWPGSVMQVASPVTDPAGQTYFVGATVCFLDSLGKQRVAHALFKNLSSLRPSVERATREAAE